MAHYPAFLTDKKSVKKRFLFLIIFIALSASSSWAYKVLYAEQFYRLFHLHFYQYPEDTNENLWYLEQALSSDFCNPLNALARIDNEQEWEKYRYLFYMHVNIRILEQYRILGSKFDKRTAYFYNAPWKEENLKSLQLAEVQYKKAFYYWEEAKKWAAKASRFRIYLEEIQNWEDESYRIMTGELDYRRIISKDLARLEKVRQDFENMNEETY